MIKMRSGSIKKKKYFPYIISVAHSNNIKGYPLFLFMKTVYF